MSWLGIAKTVAKWVTSDQGKLVLQWAGKSIKWIGIVENFVHDGTEDPLTGEQKFNAAKIRIADEMRRAGLTREQITESFLRKVIESAHGAWEEQQAKLA